MDRNVFPFSAITGQESAKIALIYGAINPRTCGVLLIGQKGCAKSTLVRAFGSLLHDTQIIEMPLNITEDMLLGTIDIESAIADGKKEFSPGLLKRADGNMLYIDEVNLLTKTAADTLLDVCQNGYAVVEREGISKTYPSRFLMIGTMNPEESLLGAQFTDRFGMYVEMKGISGKADRVEIIRRRMEYEKNPEEFCELYKAEDAMLADKIIKAKNLLPRVKIENDMLEAAAELAAAAGAAGHRAEIFIVETALSAAAYEGRKNVEKDDLHKAAMLVLPHRIRESRDMAEERVPREEDWQERQDEQPNSDTPETGSRKNRENKQNDREYTPPPEWIPDDALQNMEDETVCGQELYAVRDIFPKKKYKNSKRGSGRRSKTVSDTDRGRYTGFCFPKGKIRDVALDATLRAAAPRQKSREKNGLALSIKPCDVRQKRREHRIGNTIFFAVDASGSMGAQKRMIETKNAILSLLYDAYQKRDRVALTAFRKDNAEILLPVTRSIDLAQKRLQELPTGGRTPLAKGLMLALQMIYSEKIKDKDMIPLLILITDGKVNDRNSEAPYKDVINISKEAAKKNIPGIVIDTESSAFPLGIAKEIAEHMNAEYIKVHDLKAKEIVDIVRMKL